MLHEVKHPHLQVFAVFTFNVSGLKVTDKHALVKKWLVWFFRASVAESSVTCCSTTIIRKSV